MQCGIGCERFGEMSLKEAADTIKAHTSVLKREARDRARCCYELARLISFSVHDPDGMPLFEEFYPDYDDDEPTADSGSSWLLLREQMRAAAEYNNKKWGDRL